MERAAVSTKERPASRNAVLGSPLQNRTARLLQRKCGCGGTPGPAGECEECRKKKRLGLQAKLKINEPGDIYEQEADRIADQVMAAYSSAGVSHSPPRIQRFPGYSNEEIDGAPTSVEKTLASPGRLLEPTLRQDMEQRFGYDFSSVRVHTDAAAQQSAHEVNANAYAVGHHVVFAAGAYSPNTASGRHLLAHELAHVAQQRASSTHIIQRSPDSQFKGGGGTFGGGGSGASFDPEPWEKTEFKGGGGESGGGGSSGSYAPETPEIKTSPEAAEPAEATGAVGGRVQRILISTGDGVIIIETPSISYLYELDSLNIPLGRFSAKVVVHAKNKVEFKFEDQPSGQLFHFNYRINKGQENPATLLKGQDKVDVEVVAKTTIERGSKPLSCMIPIEEKILIRKKIFKEPLFKPLKKKVDWHFAEIPLGFLGWIDANASAGISLSGMLSGGWEDGRLTDICLLRKLGRDRFAGSARFTFGAAISPSFNAVGKLKVSADYLGAVSLASIEGKLDASAIGRLAGDLDSRVDLVYDRAKDEWSLGAEARIGGQASMRVTATASAAIELLYKEVWSKQWKLVDAEFGIGWQGGLRVGTNTKPRFEFGSLGVLAEHGEEGKSSSGPVLPTAQAPDPLATEAQVDTPAMMQAAINSETGDPAQTPQGMTPDDALPFVWCKPLEIYMKEIEIPRAIRPEKLDRDDGPTPVNFTTDKGSDTVDIGVGTDDRTGDSNWPLPVARHGTRGKTFQFVEKTAGNKRKNWLRNLFNQRLRAPGQTLGQQGYDVDHVHDKQFGGQDDLPNLWPAESRPNQWAGDNHDEQLGAYRQNISGGIVGRWFEIVDVRSPTPSRRWFR